MAQIIDYDNAKLVQSITLNSYWTETENEKDKYRLVFRINTTNRLSETSLDSYIEQVSKQFVDELGIIKDEDFVFDHSVPYLGGLELGDIFLYADVVNQDILTLFKLKYS